MPDFVEKKLYLDILDFAKQQTLFDLLDEGVNVNFFDEIVKVINTSVTNGGRITDLVEELKVYVTGDGEGVGALQRYTTQVTNDSITQFNANYNQAITQDLGIEFYHYTGTVIEGTRPFCDHFIKDYFHKKEVEKLGNGTDPLTSKSLASENLLAGRKKGTNSSNIFIYRGGYNCRHFFSPISPRFVPKKDLQRNLKNGNWKPSEREKRFLK